MAKKQTTKNKKVVNENTPKENNNEMVKLFKIVLIVTGVMIVFYGITLLVTNKSEEVINSQNEENNQPASTEIQYENIMIGTMLNGSGTYYVLIEKEDDNRLAEYESIITTIKSSEDAPAIYKANLTDSFNETYLGKEQNYYVEDLSKFRVTGTVLVKVKDGKIDAVDDSHDAIKNTLNSLK